MWAILWSQLSAVLTHNRRQSSVTSVTASTRPCERLLPTDGQTDRHDRQGGGARRSSGGHTTYTYNDTGQDILLTLLLAFRK